MLLYHINSYGESTEEKTTLKSDLFPPRFLLTALLQTGQRRAEDRRFPLQWALALWTVNQPNLTPGPGKCPCRYGQKSSPPTPTITTASTTICTAPVQLTFCHQMPSAYSITCFRYNVITNIDKLEWLVVNYAWWTEIIYRPWVKNDYLAGFTYNITLM